MFTVKQDSDPLGTLVRTLANIHCSMVIVDIRATPLEILSEIEGPAMSGSIDFADFSCTWSYYRKAILRTWDLEEEFERDGVVMLKVTYPKGGKMAYGWLPASSAGEAIKRLKKLGYLAGDMVDFD